MQSDVTRLKRNIGFAMKGRLINCLGEKYVTGEPLRGRLYAPQELKYPLIKNNWRTQAPSQTTGHPRG